MTRTVWFRASLLALAQYRVITMIVQPTTQANETILCADRERSRVATRPDSKINPDQIESKIQNCDHPWRDHEVLEQLYSHFEFTQREIADHLGCARSTVSKWMDRFDIETRDYHFQPGRHPTFSKKDGYVIAKCHVGGECDAVQIHQILACLEHDPHDVFHPEKEVHHRIGSTAIGIQIDVPENIDLMDAQTHRRLHSTGDYTPPAVEEILHRGGGSCR